MNWVQLLSLKRAGDKQERMRMNQDETRLGFEVDYDRIIFSSAFRSLQDKTQVIPLSKTDFVHTRLTHSLEVSVVGRSLGRLAGKELIERYPELSSHHKYQINDFGAIVAAAALSHDIGNPPFGHSGEKAIGEYFSAGKGQRFEEFLTPKEFHDLTHFEGNANGFRFLTESRPGVPGGLRLSYATLGAFMKYPKESLPHRPSSKVSERKFGVFQSEIESFTDLTENLGLLPTANKGDLGFVRHPLAFLVEAADDICYTLIDFEDGINLGLIEEEYALEYLIKLVEDSINTKTYSNLQYTTDRLTYLRALAINTLIRESVNIFMEHEEEMMTGNFYHSLLDRSKYQAQISDIIKVSVERIYQSEEVISKEIAGNRMLNQLLETYTNALLPDLNKPASNFHSLVRTTLPKHINESGGVYNRLIAICSHISSMTDSNIVETFKKFSGGSI